MLSALLSLLLLAAAPGGPSFQAASGPAPAPRVVDIKTTDNVILKATYYAAAKPGPAVLLLHMCNATRASWEPVARQLGEAGIHALTVDYRGYGESGGAPFQQLPLAERQRLLNETWPGDIDAALAFLVAQPGVDKARLGAGGGSCGVNHAVQAARRHREIASLVLLAGNTNREGRAYLEQTPWLPILAAAAADDQFDTDAPASMRWLLALSGNPRNKFVGFADGKHGTEIFGPHPELPRDIVAWYVDTLVTAPAGAGVAVTPARSAVHEFWAIVDRPGPVDRAVQLFRDVRRREPQTLLFPEAELNLAGYERLRDGHVGEAIALFKLNVEAYPTSANAQDSLGDGYLADGQHDLALAASQRSLALLDADRSPPEAKNAIRRSAEEKIGKLKPGGMQR